MTCRSLLFRGLFFLLFRFGIDVTYAQYSSQRLTEFVNEFTRLEKEEKLDSINLLTAKFSEEESLTSSEKSTFCLYKSIYYKRVSRYDDAITISKEGLMYCKDKSFDVIKKRLLINIADTYFTMLQFDNANQYAVQAKKINIEGYYDIDNYCITGSWFERNKRYDESIKEYEKALKLIKKYKDNCKSSQVITKVAYVYSKTGNFGKGIKLINKAIVLADSCQELVSSINARKSKYGLLKEFKKYKEANEVYDTIILLEGQYALNVRNEKMDALEAKYQNQLKTQKNASLKLINERNKEVIVRQQVFLYCTLLGLFIFGLLVFILRKFYLKQKEANAVLAVQKQLIEQNNRELLRLNVLNQKIFSVISHDFKGPITTLQLLLANETIKEVENPYFAEYIREIGLQLAQSDAMLESLLDWAKTELSITSTATNSFELNDLLYEVLQQLESKAKAKQIVFSVKVDQNISVAFPREVLKIVLRNIISNAIKFSYPNAMIEILYNHDALKIKDCGKGIPASTLNTLFQQVINPGLGTKQESGFGIGLYLSYELMQKYGGSIKALNNDDKGSTFVIDLPDGKPL